MDPKTIIDALLSNPAEDLMEEAQKTANDRRFETQATRRLDEIRAISNVAQALENLIAQCGNAPAFAGLRVNAEREVRRARLEIQRRIHGSAVADC